MTTETLSNSETSFGSEETALELMVGTSGGVLALTKMVKPETNTFTRTVAVPKT